jgi:hypothetical protein
MSVTRSYSSAALPANPAFLRNPSGAQIELPRLRAHEVTLDWFAVADRIGQHVDLDATAYANGAMVRRRGVPSAVNLLCLALLYGPGRMPLRLIAERSAALGIANVSEPALLRRLLNAAPWLEFLADALIIDRLDELAEADRSASGQFPAASHRSTDILLSQMSHERRNRQIAASKDFFLDFSPWPDELFSDSQIHWLMSTRWLFVTATIKDGPITRSEVDGKPFNALERSRLMAHLVNALASPED